jgi:hypothetical protein
MYARSSAKESEYLLRKEMSTMFPEDFARNI